MKKISASKKWKASNCCSKIANRFPVTAQISLLTAAKIIVQLKTIIKTPATKGTDACLCSSNVLMCAKRLKSWEG